MSFSKEDGGLEFKDIKYFNQALLAKQAWRCVQDPKCLFTKVLNSRYFDVHGGCLIVGMSTSSSVSDKLVLMTSSGEICVGTTTHFSKHHPSI